MVLLPVVAEAGDVNGSERVCRAGQGSNRRSRIWARVLEGRDWRVEIGGSFSGRDMVVCFRFEPGVGKVGIWQRRTDVRGGVMRSDE